MIDTSICKAFFKFGKGIGIVYSKQLHALQMDVISVFFKYIDNLF